MRYRRVLSSGSGLAITEPLIARFLPAKTMLVGPRPCHGIRSRSGFRQLTRLRCCKPAIRGVDHLVVVLFPIEENVLASGSDRLRRGGWASEQARPDDDGEDRSSTSIPTRLRRHGHQPGAAQSCRLPWASAQIETSLFPFRIWSQLSSETQRHASLQ